MKKRVLRDVVCIVAGIVLLVVVIYLDLKKDDNKDDNTVTVKEEYESLNNQDGLVEVKIEKDAFDGIAFSYLENALKEDNNIILIAKKNDNASRALMNIVGKLIVNYGVTSIDYLDFDKLSDEEKASLPNSISYDKAPILLFIKDKKILSGITNDKTELTEEEINNLYGTMEGNYIECFDIACDEDC